MHSIHDPFLKDAKQMGYVEQVRLAQLQVQGGSARLADPILRGERSRPVPVDKVQACNRDVPGN